MGKGKIGSLFSRFPKVYWTVLSFELLERGAYYSMMPILAIHFAWNVGLPIWFVAILTIFMYPFQYALPILTSALAEKVGYRRQMIFGFTVLAFAYIFLSIAFNILTAILAVMAIGFGIGCYKPLVSSTIAKSTEQKDRNVAYSVYYWIVNFAAAMFALTWGLLMLFGVFPKSAFAWVFRVSAGYFILNILIAIFIFREVPRSGQVKTFRDVGNNIATAFKDKKFVIMMLLIGGFWALYSTTLAPFLIIIYGFHFIPMWIPIILVGVINPGTIIILGGPLSKYAEKIESIKLLMGGVLVYLIGLFLITFFLEIFPIVVIGIVIYSIGEFMVAPGYLAFVSKLAPKEKVSAYIGCNFLASFSGIFGGALVGGIVVTIVAVNMLRPHFFYGLLMAFGLLILVGFMVYHRAWGLDIINRAKKIEAMERGDEEGEDEVVLDVPKPTREPLLFRMFDIKVAVLVPLILIPFILAGSLWMGTDVFYPPEDPNKPEPWSLDDYEVVVGPDNSIDAYLNENTPGEYSWAVPLNEDEYLHSIIFTLTWEDEPDASAGPGGIITFTNQPDQFSLDLLLEADPEDDTTTEVTFAEGPNSNPRNGQGTITYTNSFDHEKKESMNGAGTWAITVTCGTCGDQEGYLRTQADNGNDFTLEITTQIYSLPSDEEA
jgi:MFS family permease